MSSHPPKPPTALIILDGWGYSDQRQGNAIAQACTPTFDHLLATYPHTLLAAAGTAVGLPEGCMGNSEVGHLTIGAGRVVPSSLVLLNECLDNNTDLLRHFKQLAHTKSALHLIGLVSDAGVHSHIGHLQKLLALASQCGVSRVYVHATLDGRDTAPTCAAQYLAQVNAPIASLHGRFYAMDRDNNWDRTQASFDVLTGKNLQPSTWQSALQHAYARNETDEFVTPVLLNKDGAINDGDGVVLFNFRPDRSHQLAQLIATKLKLSFFITATNYEKKENAPTYAEAIITREPVNNTLLDVLCANNKRSFIIAESEKYAHVTYFFCGESDRTLPSEKRVLVPSIKAKNYIGHPEMRAAEITAAVIQSLAHDKRDFYLINYANADMVGHSGNLAATITACQVLDHQLNALYEEIVVERNGTIFICGDHGNAEAPGGTHTTNPVPFIAAGKALSASVVAKVRHATGLQHIAPIILESVGVRAPKQMC